MIKILAPKILGCRYRNMNLNLNTISFHSLCPNDVFDSTDNTKNIPNNSNLGTKLEMQNKHTPKLEIHDRDIYNYETLTARVNIKAVRVLRTAIIQDAP